MTTEYKDKITEHETKYIFNNSRSYQITNWLKNTCERDAQYPEGSVSSIYYDTREWKFISEKINSDYLKTKIRVRWYSDLTNQCQYNNSFLEAKFKTGSARNKVRIKIPYSGKELNHIHLENNLLLEIPYLLRSKKIVIDESLFPVFQISYKRLRYIDPFSRSRLCLDYDISAPRVNSYMMPKQNPAILNTAVFEMKGPYQDLPVSLQPLIYLGCRKASFSKYQACYQKIMQIQF